MRLRCSARRAVRKPGIGTERRPDAVFGSARSGPTWGAVSVTWSWRLAKSRRPTRSPTISAKRSPHTPATYTIGRHVVGTASASRPRAVGWEVVTLVLGTECRPATQVGWVSDT